MLMRLLVLAYDALEYTLVERLRLRDLLQKRYGRYEAAKSPKYEKPHTPSAWTTIITGKPPEEHGIDDWWTYGKILDWLRTKPPLVWIKNKRKILWKLGIKPRLYTREELRVKTIFDYAENPVALFIPGYSEPVWPHEKLNEAIKKGVQEYIRAVWEIHRWRKEEFFKRLSGDWDLFMAWFDIADLLGHVCWHKCFAQIKMAYLDLARVAARAREALGNDVAIVILSDHGMGPSGDGVTGDHTPYGFWSINQDWDWFQPRKATDFFNLFLRILREK